MLSLTGNTGYGPSIGSLLLNSINNTQLTASNPYQGSGQLIQSQPVGGGPAFVGTNSGGVQVNPSVSPAVPQSDPLDITAFAGTRFVVDLGKIIAFIDLGTVAAPQLLFGDVQMIDPNGSIHDLASLTTFRGGFAQGMPFDLPPGRYTFIVLAGATAQLIVQHIGAKNLL